MSESNICRTKKRSWVAAIMIFWGGPNIKKMLFSIIYTSMIKSWSVVRACQYSSSTLRDDSTLPTMANAISYEDDGKNNFSVRCLIQFCFSWIVLIELSNVQVIWLFIWTLNWYWKILRERRWTEVVAQRRFCDRGQYQLFCWNWLQR